MKKSQTALAAPSLLTLHVNADAGLSAGFLRVWRANDKSFDIQDAQNPGHLDLSANYKFAEGWTADPRVGFTARPSGAMEGTGLAMPPKTSSVRPRTGCATPAQRYSLALLP